MREWFDDILRVGGRVYEHPGHPYLIGICDRVAFIGTNDDSGGSRGSVGSTDVAVLDWVRSTGTARRQSRSTGRRSYPEHCSRRVYISIRVVMESCLIGRSQAERYH
jgi:hypothetical protein